MAYSESGQAPWWLHLGKHFGITADDFDTIDKDIDPFRGQYEKVKDTIEDAKKHLPYKNKEEKKIFDKINERFENTEMGFHDKLNKNTRKFVGDNIDNNNNNNNNMPGRRINTGQPINVSDSQGEEEIPIAPVPKALSNIVPDYFTIKMRCRHFTTLVLTNGAFASTRINLNNLNSPFEDSTTLDYMGLSQWKSLFSFYRILANDITVTAYNVTESSDMGGTGDRDSEGSTRINLEFTDATAARLLSARQMAECKGNINKVIEPVVTSDNYIYTFTHHYEPSQFIQTNSHVTQTGDEDRWTAVASTSSHPHYVHVGAIPNGNILATGSSPVIRLDMVCEATVQFREVLDSVLTTSQSS